MQGQRILEQGSGSSCLIHGQGRKNSLVRGNFFNAEWVPCGFLESSLVCSKQEVIR